MEEAGGRVVASAKKLVLHTGNTLCNAAVRRGTVAPGHEERFGITDDLVRIVLLWSNSDGDTHRSRRVVTLEVTRHLRPLILKESESIRVVAERRRSHVPSSNAPTMFVGTSCHGASGRSTGCSGAGKLLECISSTLKEWSAKVGSKQEQEVLEVSPCERPCMVKAEDRDELKITAKVFLLQNQPRALKEAIEKVSEALGVAHLDTVMMALPPTSLENDPLNEHLKASWLELQQLVAAGSIASLGTSDLDVSQLETLYHWAEVKPVSNQVNLASCCVMPPELTAFAKKFDIQLLTHNDAADILPAAAFESAVGDALNIPAAEWTPVWVLRYSVVIKCRGVIKCKGFLVRMDDKWGSANGCLYPLAARMCKLLDTGYVPDLTN